MSHQILSKKYTALLAVTTNSCVKFEKDRVKRY